MINPSIPLSLYIHIPWCIKKCPYCDFNSHAMKDKLPEQAYIAALVEEMNFFMEKVEERPLISIFFGGGTPSLFSSDAIEHILDQVEKKFCLSPHIEITLEANPGTIDYTRFKNFYAAGVNRLSIGIQSFQDDKLKALGRIHDHKQALCAIDTAIQAGFKNFNLDLMFGLPNQSIEDALFDLHTALSFNPPHLSWYQLTLEPNTLFYAHPPRLPEEDILFDMQEKGQQYLAYAGLIQYEVSAYSQPLHQCAHNINYWTFGDYIGIGAGAHSKLTTQGKVSRYHQIKHPKEYLHSEKRKLFPEKKVSPEEIMFEFMLNALRLSQGVPLSLFTDRTGLPICMIEKILNKAREKKLLCDHPTQLLPSNKGKQFLNDLTMMFLGK